VALRVQPHHLVPVYLLALHGLRVHSKAGICTGEARSRAVPSHVLSTFECTGYSAQAWNPWLSCGISGRTESIVFGKHC
jgi:hypothetical protein